MITDMAIGIYGAVAIAVVIVAIEDRVSMPVMMFTAVTWPVLVAMWPMWWYWKRRHEGGAR